MSQVKRYWPYLLPLAFLAIAFGIVLTAAPAPAQNSGYAGTQTNVQQVFNNQPGGSPGPSTVLIRNFGQASHWLFYCTGGSASSIQIALEASDDGVNWFQISDIGTTTGCNVVSASGYFQQIRGNLYSLIGAGATVSAWYSAASFPISDSGIVNLGVSTEKVTVIPGAEWDTNTLSSTGQLVTATPAIIYTVQVSNPNATPVYLILENSGPSGTITFQRHIPASSDSDFASDAGIVFGNNVYAYCSTTYGSVIAPSTPCFVSITYRTISSVNSLVNAAGNVIRSQLSVGSGAIP